MTKLPAIAILELFQGMWIARTIYTATRLGIADLLHDSASDVQELAVATETDEKSLYRLLRALASVEVFAEIEPRQFINTPLSTALRSDVPGSIYHMVLLFGEEWKWQPWVDLDYAIHTGKTAFSHYHGMDLWQYFAQHPEAEKIFNQGMTDFSQLVNEPLVRAYDFSTTSTLVDVGGGLGSLLTTILARYPTLSGVLFERPSVIAEAQAYLADDIKARCELVAGDFFVEVPAGADVYIIKQCIHNWDDEHCISVLENCRRAMKPESKLLIADRVILPGTVGSSFNTYWDLVQMAISSGRERTAAEFTALFAASGFKLTNIICTDVPLSIVEGVPLSA